MIDRQKLAQEMAKIADDLEYGLRTGWDPAIRERAMRRLENEQ